MRPITYLLAPVPLLALLALLFGCNFLTRSQPDNPAARYGVEREEAIFLTGGQPRTMDPALTYGGPDSPLGHIFSGLVSLDTDLRVQPDLAAGWEVSDGGTRYTFYLRPDATFHDGRPVTTADVIFSWERAAARDTGSDTVLTYLGDVVGVREKAAGEAGQIAGLRAVDEHTLEVRIDAPKSYFLAKLAYPVAFVVDRENVSESDWEHTPNGTGSFTLETWEDDQIIVLARNDGWYRDPPAVSHVVYLLDAGLPLARYENGEIDFVYVGGATLERVRDPNNPLSSDLRTTVSMCTTYLGFNTRLPPLDEPLVRRALNHALDKGRLISGVFQGNALRATGPLPPGMPAFVARPPAYPYDPERARALLAEAGYRPQEAPTIAFSTAGYGEIGPYVTAAITMWEESLGLEIEPQQLDPYRYTEELHAGNVGHIYTFGWCADYPDPQNFLDVLFHSQSPQNLGGYSNARVDALLEEARTEQDAAARLDLYAQIEEMIVADAPAAFVSHAVTAVLVKPYVNGYELTPLGVPQWHHVTLDR